MFINFLLYKLYKYTSKYMHVSCPEIKTRPKEKMLQLTVDPSNKDLQMSKEEKSNFKKKTNTYNIIQSVIF